MKSLEGFKDGLAVAAQLGCDIATAEQKVQQSPLVNGKPFLVVDGAPVYIEEVFEVPARKTGTIALHDAKSFLLAFARHKTDASVIYGSLVPGAFTAVFNDHGAGDKAPGYRDHKAIYTLKYSKEWNNWVSMNGKDKGFNGNEEFAFFIEGNAPDIVTPPAADMLQIASNFKVKISGAYKNSMSIQNGSINLEWVESVDATATVSKASGGVTSIKIPEKFTIRIPVFEGVDQPLYSIEAKLRIRVGGGSAKIWYDLMQPHKPAEQAFKAIWDKIEKEAGVPVMLGTPNMHEEHAAKVSR